MRIAGYETHPAADLFPMMDGAELSALAADIKKHGQHNPITLHVEGGKRSVLDGRNRLAACELAGVAPTVELWTGEGSPVSWVVSQNLHRRQLTASQRAMVAAGLVPMFEAEAKERQRATQIREGKAPSATANLRGPDHGTAAARAAEAVNVSPRSVESALKVTREAKPAVVEAVKRGEVAVSAAVRDLKPLPKTKTSRPPKAAPTYSMLITMPTDRVGEVSKALRAIGFESTKPHGSHDAEMKLTNHPEKRTA